MSPFPNQRVVPEGHAEHHRAVPLDAMTSECTILPPSTGPRPYGAPAAAAPQPIYAGPCDVQRQAAGDGNVVQAEQSQNVTQYQVTFPLSMPAIAVGERGAIIKITRSSDPLLVGRTLRAVSVMYGSILFERTVLCEDNQTQNMP